MAKRLQRSVSWYSQVKEEGRKIHNLMPQMDSYAETCRKAADQ